MKKIPLSQNRFAIVDDEDYEWLSRSKWRVMRSGKNFYAMRQLWAKPNRGKSIFMHREILGLTYGDGTQTDHVNGDGLDNRRTNLRPCNHQENHFNQRSQIGKSSKYKGVYWDKTHRKWAALIYYKPQMIRLGYYDDEVEAAKTYDKRAQSLFGEFARINIQE